VWQAGDVCKNEPQNHSWQVVSETGKQIFTELARVESGPEEVF